jgi:hypothetical protein
MLGLDVVIMFEDNKETKNILEKQTSPKHRNVMGETNI